MNENIPCRELTEQIDNNFEIIFQNYFPWNNSMDSKLVGNWTKQTSKSKRRIFLKKSWCCLQ